jgi:hypothetical protein
MNRLPFFLPFLACSTFLVAGALSRHAAPALRGAHESPPDKDLPAAAELLSEAAAALAPDRLPWLETAVWQNASGEDGRFVARGRLWTAPGGRQRLELTVRVGKTVGTLLLVCDGRVFQQVTRVGLGDPVVTQQDVPSDPSAGAENVPVSGELGPGGLTNLLIGIRQHLTAPKVRRASWKGQAVFRVSGGWQTQPMPQDTLPSGLRPAKPPQACVVLLDAKTLWPHRVEWAGERDAWQIEFRDPLPNQPLTPMQCDRLFAVPAPRN